jgi:anti-sigma28 factor (negative regulator of flagellin synthesis)
MRVNDSNLNAITTTANTQRSDGAASRAGGGKQGGGNSADQVSLSRLSSSLSASVDSPERAAHVARLAATYQSGNYQVNAQAVSQSVVGDAIRSS